MNNNNSKKLPCIKKLHNSNGKPPRPRNRKSLSCGVWEPDPLFKTICFDRGRFEAIRRITTDLGFHEVSEIEYWNIVWTDCPISLEKALKMRRNQDAPTKSMMSKYSPHYLQRANHFPGMMEVCRKDRLASNLNRMKKSFPKDYNFFPTTWSLPTDSGDLKAYAQRKKDVTFICKPDTGSQGRGIFLVKNAKRLDDTAKFIVQKYLHKPFLIDDYKFDLRIYVFVTSCDPLRIYIYNEGLARFATIKYCQPTDQNIDVLFMHLTNYSLNKFSQSYVPEDGGSKRKLTDIYKWLLENNWDVLNLIDEIDQLVIKTMVAVQPTLRHYYRTYFPKRDRESACFEILGFDILLDHRLKPYLCEVNHSPSFNMDLLVDAEVKTALLEDIFNMIHLGDSHHTMGETTPLASRNSSRMRYSNSGEKILPLIDNPDEIPKELQAQFQYEKEHLGNFRQIYPAKNGDKYSAFFNQTKCPTLLDQSINVISPRGKELKLPVIPVMSEEVQLSESESFAYLKISKESDEIKRIKRLRQIVDDLRNRKSSHSLNTLASSSNISSASSTRLPSPCLTFKSTGEPLPKFSSLKAQDYNKMLSDFEKEREMKSKIEELKLFLHLKSSEPEPEKPDLSVYAKAALAAVKASKGGKGQGHPEARSSNVFKEEWLSKMPMGNLLRANSRDKLCNLKPSTCRKLPCQIAEIAKQKVKASVLKMEMLKENEYLYDFVRKDPPRTGQQDRRNNNRRASYGGGESCESNLNQNLKGIIKVSISPYKKPWNNSTRPL